MTAFLEKGRVRERPRFSIKHMWDQLEDAARQRRKCVIRYKKPKRGTNVGEYFVAPYSFRQSRGGEVLFAYDFADGHIKSFFRDRVRGVFVTNNRFRPKWEVEIGQEKAMDSVYTAFYALAALTKGYDLDAFMGDGLSAKKGVTVADVDPDELKRGIAVEMEHTRDPEIARKIALDHLAEFRTYYTALAKMEQGLRAGKGNVEEKDVMGSPPAAGGAAINTKPDVVKPRITR